MEFTIILICGICQSANGSINFDVENRSFLLRCMNCGFSEEPEFDLARPPTLKEHDLILEKRRLKAQLKKIKN